MKKNWLKRVLSIALAVVMAGSLAACGNSQNTEESQQKKSVQQNGQNVPEVVNIGVQTLITPELVARYEKIYEKYLGTKVNLVQFDSGADVNKAFSGKSVDIAAFGTSPAALGISGNLGFEVFWYYDVIGSAETLIATKKSGATKIDDLKGLKVGTPFASTAHYSLLNALKQAGIDPGEVELLDMQPDDIYAAWKRGDIDAAYVWNPVLGELKKDGVVITDSAKLAEQGIVTADVGAVRKEFAELSVLQQSRTHPFSVTAYAWMNTFSSVLHSPPTDRSPKTAGAQSEYDFPYPQPFVMYTATDMFPLTGETNHRSPCNYFP